MLVPIANRPLDYAWGSTTLLAELEGRVPTGRIEAEVWFGDHPANPAVTAEGARLDAWLAEHGEQSLPYLLKLLAAASTLSIQAHPSQAQAAAGFAREEAAGIPRDAPARTYRDANHKPELIVALSPRFRALAGLRPIARTRVLLSGLGAPGAELAARLDDPLDAIAWVLSDEAHEVVRALIATARSATSPEFDAELALVADLDDLRPGDPGIVVALLMNLVTLRAGEGLFVPAGVLHAYLEGLGVEIMAASDNVLRGGLTPKHIDVAELVSVLDASDADVPILEPVADAPGVERYDVPVDDFSLRRVRGGDAGSVAVDGLTIALATRGRVTVRGGASGETVTLDPGQALLVTTDERVVHVDGDGELFLASPGR
ncbi:mannose-6-phosphate isomerase, class I [Microbacterium aoyamense]|uniref:mannose-6-phosphate isomerase n=1 Tax=Microbacterium aoyamense TaxID=344166 RepID=A0ABP5AYZ4_9MICO|nr:mannose-6-phosphate isomerase, class I [Microbacterium aoyamense]